MAQEIKNRSAFNVINNSPDELIEITIPGNWWISNNTYFFKKNKSLKIIDLKQKQEKDQFTISSGDWNIKSGDYFISDFPYKTPISKELRRKIQISIFVLILLGSGLISWLVAFIISQI